MASLQETLDAALVHHQQGRLTEAAGLYREVLAADPRQADALYLLGRIEHQHGRFEQAITLHNQAIASDPVQANYYQHLGEALRELGDQPGAIAAYRQALALDPRYAVAYVNLAKSLEAAGDSAAAEAALRQALAIQPKSAAAHHGLGTLLNHQRRWAEARTSFEALRIQPNLVESQNNLGNTYRGEGRFVEAVAAFQRAIRCNPQYAPAYFNLGITLNKLGRLSEAAAAYEQAIRLRDDDFEAIANLGAVWNDLGQLEKAMAACRRAIVLNPRSYAAHGNLGVCLQSQGRLDEAIEAYRTATRLCPENAAQHSNLLYVLNYHPSYDPPSVFAEHREWARRHADPLMPANCVHSNDRSPTRRLRVGYVSPYFRRHAVNSFTEGILSSHDHDAYEVFCYSDVPPALADGTTQRQTHYADHWCDLIGRDDDWVARRIRDDRIDLLVDLTGHIGGNRLLVFARKPAPVQVTYIGYQNTTGMQAMDYRLTDAWSDPPGATDAYYTESLVRLPESFFCFRPGDEAPAVGPLPAAANGYVTFGSFNSYAKVTPQVLATWAEILTRVPGARLLLLVNVTESLRASIFQAFEQHGVDSARIELCPPRPVGEFLELVGRADLALDTFPFNGHTTTCDSLWQGVPVVALAGKTYAARFGSVALVKLGLEDLIARTTEQYVEIAVRLAGDLPRLETLRSGLREGMRHSPLLDAAGFTRRLEAAYREMWVRWCDSDRSGVTDRKAADRC